MLNLRNIEGLTLHQICHALPFATPMTTVSVLGVFDVVISITSSRSMPGRLCPWDTAVPGLGAVAPSAVGSLPGKISAMQVSSLTGRYCCRPRSHDLKGRMHIACRTSHDFMRQLHAVSGQVLIFT